MRYYSILTSGLLCLLLLPIAISPLYGQDSIHFEDFNRGFIRQPAALVQGKISGLSVSKAGGNPNGKYYLRIRGLSTILAEDQPLVVIDGVPAGSLDQVDPLDIECIVVLKPGLGAARYGARSSSGVLLVNTKRGETGKTLVEYRVQLASTSVACYPEAMNAEEWRSLSARNGLGTDFGYQTDWMKEITQRAPEQEHGLALSGGNGKTMYRASLNYRDGKGVLVNTGYSRFTGRLNLSQQALKDRLKLDLDLANSLQESQEGFEEAFRHAAIYNPTAPVRSDLPEYEQWDGYFNQVLFNYYNPVQIVKQNLNNGERMFLSGVLKATYTLIEGLDLETLLSFNEESVERKEYFDRNSFWLGHNEGYAYRSYEQKVSQYFNASVNYSREGEAWKLELRAGYDFQSFEHEGFHAGGGDFLTDAFTYNNLGAARDFTKGLGDIGSFKSTYVLTAFSGYARFNYHRLLSLQAGSRYEGCSRFGINEKWALYPSLSARFNLASILGLQDRVQLGLKASWEITGNIPPGSYLSLQRYNILGPKYFYNGEFLHGATHASNPNPDLGPEKSTDLNFGLDFTLPGTGIRGSIDYYTRKSRNLYYYQEIPVPPNLYPEILLNLGELHISGVEFYLDYLVVERENFLYHTALNVSWNLKQELNSLSGSYNGTTLEYGVRDLGSPGSPGHGGSSLIRSKEGEPVGQLLAHTFEGVDPDGNSIISDLNRDGGVAYTDKIIHGNGLPTLELGWEHRIRYRAFSLDVLLRGVFGHKLLNLYQSFYGVPNIIGSYNPSKSAVDLRNPDTGTLLNDYSLPISDIHIENASYLCLDNIRLAYRVKSEKLSHITGVEIFLAGNNLFYLGGYTGSDPNVRYADPETYYWRYSMFTQHKSSNVLIPGIDRRNTWYRTRSFSIGASFTF